MALEEAEFLSKYDITLTEVNRDNELLLKATISNPNIAGDATKAFARYQQSGRIDDVTFRGMGVGKADKSDRKGDYRAKEAAKVAARADLMKVLSEELGGEPQQYGGLVSRAEIVRERVRNRRNEIEAIVVIELVIEN